jgi:hypothetical protein
MNGAAFFVPARHPRFRPNHNVFANVRVMARIWKISTLRHRDFNADLAGSRNRAPGGSRCDKMGEDKDGDEFALARKRGNRRRRESFESFSKLRFEH